MKYQLSDLMLFSEEQIQSGGENCAAEQSGADEISALEPTETVVADDTVAEIAKAIGMEGADGAALISRLNSNNMRHALSERLRERNAVQVYERLISEAELLKNKISGFDIEKELANKKFSAMLAGGLSVEEAWQAVHFNEIMGAAIAAEKEKVRNETLKLLAAGIDRPSENGTGGYSAADTKASVAGLSGKSIRDILKRVENGAKIKF